MALLETESHNNGNATGLIQKTARNAGTSPVPNEYSGDEWFCQTTPPSAAEVANKDCEENDRIFCNLDGYNWKDYILQSVSWEGKLNLADWGTIKNAKSNQPASKCCNGLQGCDEATDKRASPPADKICQVKKPAKDLNCKQGDTVTCRYAGMWQPGILSAIHPDKHIDITLVGTYAGRTMADKPADTCCPMGAGCASPATSAGAKGCKVDPSAVPEVDRICKVGDSVKCLYPVSGTSAYGAKITAIHFDGKIDWQFVGAYAGYGAGSGSSKSCCPKATGNGNSCGKGNPNSCQVTPPAKTEECKLYDGVMCKRYGGAPTSANLTVIRLDGTIDVEYASGKDQKKKADFCCLAAGDCKKNFKPCKISKPTKSQTCVQGQTVDCKSATYSGWFGVKIKYVQWDGTFDVRGYFMNARQSPSDCCPTANGCIDKVK